MNNLNIVYNDDCLNILKKIDDKSIDLICIDPPYGVLGTRVDWDFGKGKKKQNEYFEFMFKCFDEVKRVLKDNGNFVFFHNDFKIWSILNNYLLKKELFYKGVVHLIKNNHFTNLWKYTYEKQNLKSLFNITEQFFYYTNYKKTGLENRLLFKSLKIYAYELLNYIGMNKGELVKKEGGKVDHFFRTDYKFINKELGNRKSVHFFYGGTDYKFIEKGINDNNSQRNLLTEETYNILIDKYKIDKWEGFKIYKELLNEYKGLLDEYSNNYIPVHNLFNNHNNVWDFGKQNNGKLHPTQKPEEMMERIIKIFSNEGATVLDFFAGTGTTLVAAKKLKRNYIGVEQDKKFFDIINDRLNEK